LLTAQFSLDREPSPLKHLAVLLSTAAPGASRQPKYQHHQSGHDLPHDQSPQQRNESPCAAELLIRLGCMAANQHAAQTIPPTLSGRRTAVSSASVPESSPVLPAGRGEPWFLVTDL